MRDIELATVRSWKSETYRALVGTDLVKATKDRTSVELSDQLVSILRVFKNYKSQAGVDVCVLSIFTLAFIGVELSSGDW